MQPNSLRQAHFDRLNTEQDIAYKEAIDWLFQQFPSYQNIGASAYKPDLVNIQLLCQLFNDPQNDLKFVHIAGTNGKGSTSSMLSSILTASGEKVGLFTSPHIIDFRERIRINGEKISERVVLSFCQDIQKADLNFEPSFFEISFVMALFHFKKNKCTICVIETGLGGRLDATNIITPLISVITNISLEHTQFLGNTLQEIAGEKAGIIKSNVPVIIGETSIETKPVFKQIAESRNVEIIWCEENEFSNNFQMPLLGSYQKENFRTVLCTIKVLLSMGFAISDEIIESGLKDLHKNTGFFGRLQIVDKSPLTILDVSHNYIGIQKTLETINELNKGQLYIIYGSSSDKDYNEIISLFPKTAHLNLCAFSNSRSLSFEELNSLAETMHPTPMIYTNIHLAIQNIQSIANKEDTILVFGSFFLISDFF